MPELLLSIINVIFEGVRCIILVVSMSIIVPLGFCIVFGLFGTILMFFNALLLHYIFEPIMRFLNFPGYEYYDETSPWEELRMLFKK